jgi:hypothetical protein
VRLLITCCESVDSPAANGCNSPDRLISREMTMCCAEARADNNMGLMFHLRTVDGRQIAPPQLT